MHNDRSRFRLGLIGCGFMSDLYHKIFTGYGCTVSACCDPTPSKLERFAGERNISERYTDYKDLIASGKLDGIISATPDYLHIPVATAASGAGLPLMTEKPFASSLEEAELFALSHSTALMVVNFSKRNAPAVAAVQDLLVSSRLGEIHHFNISYFQGWACTGNPGYVPEGGRENWRFDALHAPAGVSGDLGSHLFDLVELLFGAVTLVSAVQQRVMKVSSSPDAFHALVRLDSGAEGIVQVSRIASGESDHFCLQVYGSSGSCVMDLEKDRKGIWFFDNRTGRREYLEGKKGTGTYRHFLHLLEHRESALPLQYPDPGIEAALRNQRCLEAVERSSEAGGSPVNLSTFKELDRGE